MTESVRAELAAVTESIDSYRSRISAIVERIGPESEDLATVVYEAERALSTAYRLLSRAEKLAR